MIRLLLSLYRDNKETKVPEVKGEINILNKAVSSTTPVQNGLLSLTCLTLALLFIPINYGNLGNIFHVSSCDQDKKYERHVNVLTSCYGYSLVLAGFISGTIHILLNSYISAFSANQYQSQVYVNSRLVVLTLFSAFAVLGLNVYYSVLYTSFFVLIVFTIHSFIICHKVYKLHKLLLRCQIKTAGLFRDGELSSAIRCYRLESNFIAILICASHFVGILLFACSTALSIKLFLFAVVNYKQCNAEFRRELFENLTVLNLVVSIFTTILSLVVTIPGVAYTVYFVVKKSVYNRIKKLVVLNRTSH